MAGLTIKTTLINKRINSTGYKFQTTMPLYNHTYDNVFLKDGTSILTPTFIVERPNIKALNTLPLCNYLYCEEFLRYYWIRDVKTGSGRQSGSGYFIELICEVDVLASWLAEIKGTPCWLKYCSDMDTTLPNSNTKLVDLSLDDDRLSPEIVFGTGVISMFDNSKNNPFATPGGTTSAVKYSYVVKMSAMSTGASASVIHIMDATNFASFIYSIYTDGKYANVTNLNDLIKTTVKDLGGINLDPNSWIEDMWIVPIPYERFTAKQSASKVWVGSVGPLLLYTYDSTNGIWSTDNTNLQSIQVLWNTTEFYAAHESVIELNTANNGLLNNGGRYETGSDAALIPFLRRKKYTKILLRTPCGELDISSDSFSVNNSRLKIRSKLLIDYITGDYSITVWDDNTEEFLGKIHGNISLKLGNLFTGSGTAGPMAGLAAKTVGTIFSLGAAGNGEYFSKKFNNKDLGKAITKNYAATGKTLTDFGGSISSGSVSGTVNSSNNGWIDFLDMVSVKNVSPGGTVTWSTNLDNVFQFVTSGFVPYPCMVYEDYEAFGKLWGFPVEKYLEKGIKDVSYYSFVQCSNFNVRCGLQAVAVPNGSDSMKMLVSGMLPEEAERINDFLDNGIYLEEDPLPPE